MAEVRAARPGALVVVASDHGEEFGEHGGHYHGTTLYDEQVRVPLVFYAPPDLPARRVAEPVSLVDVVPTLLAALGVPASPRLHGRDLGALLAGRPEGEGFAFAETDELAMLARGGERLICERRIGACRLYDLAADPGQRDDASAEHMGHAAEMRSELGTYVAGLGRYEGAATAGGDERGATPGAGAPWPPALRRALAGDGDAAAEVAPLLRSPDPGTRRKAAEVLFELGRAEAAPELRAVLQREKDATVRRWCALALTRLGQGATLTFDLLAGDEPWWRRLAALALAQAGDGRGERILVEWLAAAFPEPPAAGREALSFARGQQVVVALGGLRSEVALGPLGRALGDLRLRPYAARALANIGRPAARPVLARFFETERYLDARVALGEALVELGARGELRRPLGRWLGVPDPLPDGLGLALRAGIAHFVGAPRQAELERLRRFATSGVSVGVVVPEGGNGRGFRAIVRARSTDGAAGQVRFGLLARGQAGAPDPKAPVPRRAPRLDASLAVALTIPPAAAPQQIYGTLPDAAAAHLRPGEHADIVLYATQNVELDAAALVPLADEIPPPSPEPWQPAAHDAGGPGGRR
ncbi:MAG: sulfatase-like hydrolase/transferase [Deltaproteobacteria bacterium]|nr:sulfatase-like hydrolase/transferase [Deltaproteobacteria bacterium]